MPALKARMLHLCETLFAGKISHFAAALHLHPDHLRHALRSRTGISAGVVAQVVSLTNVRAEWLLCGAGPVFREEAAPETESSLRIPLQTQSAFPMLDTSTMGPSPATFTPAVSDTEPTNAVLAAGQAVYRAGVARRAAILFLGCSAFLKAAPTAVQFLRRGYLTAIALPSAAVALDIPGANLASIAHMGALQGLGLGEALSCWGFTACPAPESVLYTARQRALPTIISVAFGDAYAQYHPALRGAEFGAALGATAYVDMLIFAEQVKAIQGGVFIIAGDSHRAETQFQTAIYAASRCMPPPPLIGFSVIALGDAPSANFQQFVRARGGAIYHIHGTYETAADELLQATAAAYDGVTA